MNRIERGHIFVMNPKTLGRLDVSAYEVGRLSDHGSIFVDIFDPHVKYQVGPNEYDSLQVGNAELVLPPISFRPEGYLRIHGEVVQPRSGYGIALYGAAAVVARRAGYEGVYSFGFRTREAASFWDKLVFMGIAQRDGPFDKLSASYALRSGLVEIRR